MLGSLCRLNFNYRENAADIALKIIVDRNKKIVYNYIEYNIISE